MATTNKPKIGDIKEVARWAIWAFPLGGTIVFWETYFVTYIWGSHLTCACHGGGHQEGWKFLSMQCRGHKVVAEQYREHFVDYVDGKRIEIKLP